VSTKHLVDPQLVALLEEFPPLQLSREILPALRAGAAELFQRGRALAPPDSTVTVTEERVPGPAGAPAVRVVIYRPSTAGSLLPALLHIHGGGYVMGTPELSDENNRRLVKEVDCIVVSVDYRLAPETRHPGPVEDCYAALKWLHANSHRLGVDATRIAVGGESAGGGLSAALALLARDRREVRIAYQSLIYPMIDDRTGASADPHPYVGEFVWTPATNHFGWQCLLGCEPGSKGVSHYAAAARAESLADLPATYIATGALDLFLEEDLEYARRLIRAGVPTELHVYPGAFHGFEMAAEADVTKVARRNSVEALKVALHGRSRRDS
jgi:acetyl esterase/lipase